MTELSDQQYRLHFGGIHNNSFKCIRDQNIAQENSPNQLTKQSSYYDIDQFTSLAIHYKDYFTVFSSNIQSIHAKFNKLEILIEEFKDINFKFTVICLQECWINNNNSDSSLIQLSGYNSIIYKRKVVVNTAAWLYI